MNNKFIAIIQTGQAIPSALEKYGDFDQWFIHGMAIDQSRTKTYRVFEELVFPDINQLAGVIITGSSAMVTQEKKWSEATINWLRPLLAKNIPILGVCYGHQLLAKLLGGKVDWNPKGRQIGQINMVLNRPIYQDKLFKNILNQSTKNLKFLATHQQSVIKLPDDTTLLGSTELDPSHCFRYKGNIWGLQFHPEFTAEIIREYIHARFDDIVQDGLNPNQLLSKIESNNNGNKLLQRFRDICFST